MIRVNHVAITMVNVILEVLEKCFLFYLIQWTAAFAIFPLALFILKTLRLAPLGASILEPDLQKERRKRMKMKKGS